MNKTKVTILLTGLSLALGASPALAQSPADDVYGSNQGVLDTVATSKPAPKPSSSKGTAPSTASKPETKSSTAPATTTAPAPVEQAKTGQLPFTGFQAGLVAFAGLALVGGGAAMRRASRDRS